MIVFKQPKRLALAKQRANDNFLIRHRFKRQFFVFQSPTLCRPEKIIQIIETNPKKPDIRRPVNGFTEQKK